MNNGPFLVIGASGFIGSHIYSYAKKLDYSVIGTTFSKKSDELIKYDLMTDDIERVLPDGYLVTKTQGCVVICSAIAKIDTVYSEKERSRQINVDGTIRVIDTIKSLGLKIVFLSTEAVFDGLQGYYDESVMPYPVNEYGRQKVEVEKYLLSNCPSSLVVRLGMVVGDNPYEKHLFGDWHNQIKNKGNILCIEGQVFSPTFVGDVASGIVMALKGNLEGCYHLSNQEFFSRDELARQFLYITGYRGEIIVKPVSEFKFLEKRAMKTYLDGTRFIKATAIHFTSMREVLKSFRMNLENERL